MRSSNEIYEGCLENSQFDKEDTTFCCTYNATNVDQLLSNIKCPQYKSSNYGIDKVLIGPVTHGKK